MAAAAAAAFPGGPSGGGMASRGGGSLSGTRHSSHGSPLSHTSTSPSVAVPGFVIGCTFAGHLPGMLGPATLWPRPVEVEKRSACMHFVMRPLATTNIKHPTSRHPTPGRSCVTVLVAAIPPRSPRWRPLFLRVATTLTFFLPMCVLSPPLPPIPPPPRSSPFRAFPQQTRPCASRPSSSTRSRRGRSSPRTSAPYVLSPRCTTPHDPVPIALRFDHP